MDIDGQRHYKLQIGNYRLLKKISTGTSGIVYQGQPAITSTSEHPLMSTDDPHARLEQGKTFLQQHTYVAALAAFTKALRLLPESVVAWTGKGDAHFGLKRYEKPWPPIWRRCASTLALFPPGTARARLCANLDATRNPWSLSWMPPASILSALWPIAVGAMCSFCKNAFKRPSSSTRRRWPVPLKMPRPGRIRARLSTILSSIQRRWRLPKKRSLSILNSPLLGRIKIAS